MVVLERKQSDSSQTTARSIGKKGHLKETSSLDNDDNDNNDDNNNTPSKPLDANDNNQQQGEQSRPLAYFHRSEIEIDRRKPPLGEGYHGIVYEIQRIHLMKDNHHLDHNLSPQQQETRRRCCQQLHKDTNNGHKPRYVLKHLHPRLLKQGSRQDVEHAAMALLAEARFLQLLNHPNILPLVGLAFGGATAFRGGHYDGFFLITERLRETLANRIHRWKHHNNTHHNNHNQTTVPARSMRYRYAYQIAKALEYLHQQQLIFRDLKPSNIGFAADDPDRIQVFDFGLCRKLPSAAPDAQGTSSDCHQVFDMSGGVGTRRYCAVEVCLRRPYNAKADVYSWAMVFWELLTLEKPFADFSKEDHEKFVCEMGGSLNLSKYNLPGRIQSLLRNAWARNVAKRWSMTQVCDEMESILGAEQEKQGSESLGSGKVLKRERRRSKVMDRKDVVVNLEEECSSSMGFLAATA